MFTEVRSFSLPSLAVLSDRSGSSSEGVTARKGRGKRPGFSIFAIFPVDKRAITSTKTQLLALSGLLKK